MMQIAARESHREGLRVLKHKGLEPELIELIEQQDLRLDKGSTLRIKAVLAEQLRLRAWATPLKLDADLGVVVNGIKDEVAVQVQLGNMARAFYDLMKFQALHEQRRAACGVLIMPTARAARRLGENHVQFERV